MDALESLHIAAQQAPRNAEVWTHLGMATLQSGLEHDSDAALNPSIRTAGVAALMHALVLEPTDATLCLQIGRTLDATGETEGGLLAFQRACSLAPTRAEPHEHLSRLLYRIGRDDEAAAAIQRAMQVEPNSPGPRLVAAQALQAQGQREQALALTKEACALAPDNLDARWALAQRLSDNDAREDCVSAWRSVVELSPEDPRVLTALGVALAVAGDTGEAIETLEQVVARFPESPEAYLNLSRVQRESGALATAIENIRRALELDPDSVDAHLDLALALETDSTADAMDLYRKVIDTSPPSAAANHGLGRLLHAQGQHKEAVEVLVRATGIEPDNEAIQTTLATVFNERMDGEASSLSGNLQEFGVIEALEFLRVQGSRGVLRVSGPDGQARLGLGEGDILFALTAGAPRFSELIVASGAVAAWRATEVLANCPRPCSDENLASALIASGDLDDQAVKQAFAEQTLAAIDELLNWEQGSFTFEKRELRESREPREVHRMNGAGAVMEVLRRRDERAHTQQSKPQHIGSAQ